MKVVTFSEARNKLKALCDEVRASHKPVQIHRRGGDDVVIVSADDWEALEETLYVASMPGASERLRNPGDFKPLTPFTRETFDRMVDEERAAIDSEADASKSA